VSHPASLEKSEDKNFLTINIRKGAEYLGHFRPLGKHGYHRQSMTLEALLISRDPEVSTVLEPVLANMAVTLDVCVAATAGGQALLSRKFDAVIFDCDDLPGGIEILQALRKTRSNQSSVAFAILNGETTTQKAFELGANFVLQKPLTTLNATRCFNAALSFMTRERRRYFRHPIEMSVKVVFAEGQEFMATTTNVSEGGMSVRCRGKLPKATSVTLEFTLPGTNLGLELGGEVAWIDDLGRAGIRFTAVPQSSQYQIEKWLTDQLEKQLPSVLKPHLSSR
jgi:CheY-like chemotaxis protein